MAVKMRLLELTLEEPEWNLALDEALLDEADCGAMRMETLRLWESPRRFVAVGRASRLAAEVNLVACAADGVPVLRRASGGTAVVGGPGCLMYAVVLDLQRRPTLRAVDMAHKLVLETVLAGLRKLAPEAARRGTSDLALGDRKFSGNSLRIKRRALLYHGTLLYDFDLAAIGRYLSEPVRQPAWRRGRDHLAFVCNVPVAAAAARRALAEAWQARAVDAEWPRDRTNRLVEEKYRRREWNERLP
jgi:lipoate-protein ligase A